ncbi:hypothetical protein EI94DRAFT_1701076 [Lactarius quietus]|nr:hypothetical protein EI94DRAFT_1701076 [Lactarius quietus]
MAPVPQFTVTTVTTVVHGDDRNNPNLDDDRDDHNDHNDHDDHSDVPHDYNVGDGDDRQHLHCDSTFLNTSNTMDPPLIPGGYFLPPVPAIPRTCTRTKPVPTHTGRGFGGRGKGSDFLPRGYPCQSLNTSQGFSQYFGQLIFLLPHRSSADVWQISPPPTTKFDNTTEVGGPQNARYAPGDECGNVHVPQLKRGGILEDRSMASGGLREKAVTSINQ